MRDLFYIWETEDGFYQLREREGHEVVSTSSTRQGILERLETIVERYATRGRFQKAMKDREMNLPLRRQDIASRQVEFDSLRPESQLGMETHIKNAIRNARKNSKVQMILPSKVGIKPVEKKAKEVEVIKRVKIEHKKIGLIRL